MAAIIFKWLLLFHPFFISVTDVNHNISEQSLEISVRIFTDDFEKTLRKNNPATKVDLAEPKVKKAMDELIKKYVPAHLQLTAEGKKCTINYVGFEKIEESTWCYFEVANIKSIKQLLVNNTLLYDWQTKQSNMCIVHINGQEKTQKVVYPDSEILFEF